VAWDWPARAWPRGTESLDGGARFPVHSSGVELARLSLAPIPVDAGDIDIDQGLRHAPDARPVIVTPGQQAPLGVILLLERRLRLLDWAAQEGVWVIEDDYLSELQLKGASSGGTCLTRSRRARHPHRLLQQDTISPTLRPGFLVAPISLLSRFAEVAACLAPPPGPSGSSCVTAYYLRHLRRTKRACSAQRDALLQCLQLRVKDASIAIAGLAALLRLARASSGYRDGTKQASREILRASLRDHRALEARVFDRMSVSGLGLRSPHPPMEAVKR